MILTVTLNTALDVTYVVSALEPHTSHRVTEVSRRAGGKGLNVARVLRQLGRPALATGFVGGPLGAAVIDDLEAAGIPHRFVDGGWCRQTVTVVDATSGEATVFLEPGPEVGERAWSEFVDLYGRLAADAHCVVFSGSLPPGLPADAYAQLCALTPGTTLVDTGGEALVATARAGANVLLPNAAELREATGRFDPVEGAAALLREGAEAVVASMGADGLLGIARAGAWRVPSVERLRGNPTGAGDALAAALAATEGLPWPDRLREALAWSAAAVPMPLAGEVDLDVLARVARAAVVDDLEEAGTTDTNG